MECRTRILDLTLLSANGLSKSSTFGKLNNVYAVASISDNACNVQKFKTPVNKGTDPVWNFPMKFTVNEAAGLQNRLTLIIKIKAVRMFVDQKLGEVRVPIKELLEGVKTERNSTVKTVSYQLSGKPKGDVSFSYRFGKRFYVKVQKPVVTYSRGSSSAYGSAAVNTATVVSNSSCGVGGGCGG